MSDREAEHDGAGQAEEQGDDERGISSGGSSGYGQSGFASQDDEGADAGEESGDGPA